MNTKITNGLYLLALPIVFFVISNYTGVDASKSYSEYPEAEGKILEVERLQLENKRHLRSTTDYYEIRVKIENDNRVFFYRSPHPEDISRYQAKIRKGQLAKIKYQERMDRGMNRIMDLSCDGLSAMPFGEIVGEARGKDRLIGFFSILIGIAGAVLIWIGVKEKQNANQAAA